MILIIVGIPLVVFPMMMWLLGEPVGWQDGLPTGEEFNPPNPITTALGVISLVGGIALIVIGSI